MIDVENVTFKYPNCCAPVILGFSACFERGEIVAVTGRNGCGKTTMTKLLVGILRPAKGRVSIDGADTAKMDLFEIGQKLGYIFQNPDNQLLCDTVFSEVAYGARNQGLPENEVSQKADRYLELFDLSQYRETYPGKLSLGEKQRLALAAVLALGTDYLALDEPTAGLDIYRRRQLGDLLLKLKRELNCGIVLVSHERAFIADYADRELVMR